MDIGIAQLYLPHETVSAHELCRKEADVRLHTHVIHLGQVAALPQIVRILLHPVDHVLAFSVESSHMRTEEIGAILHAQLKRLALLRLQIGIADIGLAGIEEIREGRHTQRSVPAAIQPEVIRKTPAGIHTGIEAHPLI